MQQITDYLLKCMNVKQTAEVFMLQQNNKGLINEQAG